MRCHTFRNVLVVEKLGQRVILVRVFVKVVKAYCTSIESKNKELKTLKNISYTLILRNLGTSDRHSGALNHLSPRFPP